MELAVDLIARQLSLLLVLAALGSGPATVLPSSVPAIVRIAMVPALGLALGAATMVTVAYLVPMSIGAWAVMLPLAIASTAIAVFRCRGGGEERDRRTPGGFQFAGVALVAVGVMAAVDAPLMARDSFGPMGYEINDSGYLTAQRFALEQHPLGDLGISYDLDRPNPFATFRRSARRPFADLFEKQWAYVPAGFVSIAAGVNTLFGWSAVDTQTPFLGVLILIAALSGFGLVFYLTASLWAAVLAGLLFVGPLGYQLYVESAEASRAGIAILPAAALVGALLVQGLDLRLSVLLGMLLAGLGAVYPLWVPTVVMVILATGACFGAARARRGRLARRDATRLGQALGAAALVAVLQAPVAFARGLHFSHLIAATDFVGYLVESGLPGYELTALTAPGWLLNMREVHSLEGPDLGDLAGFARGFVLPFLLLLLAIFGAWRFRHKGALLVLAPVPVVCLLAYYIEATDHCSYCVQRQLAILEPSSAVLLATGFAAIPLAADLRPFSRLPAARRTLTICAVLAGLGTLLLAAQQSRVAKQRALDGGQVFDGRARNLAQRLRPASAPVLLEFAGEGGVSLPAAFWSAYESSGSRPALHPRTEGFFSINSFYDADPSLRVGARTDYRSVLTRMRGIETARRTIAASGPYALQARAHPFDVTVVAGAIADVMHDPKGRAWVRGPLSFLVAADPARRAWLRIGLRGPGVPTLDIGHGRLFRRGASAAVCVAIPGRSPLRVVDIPLTYELAPPVPAPERYALSPLPGKELRVTRAFVGERPCVGRLD